MGTIRYCGEFASSGGSACNPRLRWLWSAAAALFMLPAASSCVAKPSLGEDGLKSERARNDGRLNKLVSVHMGSASVGAVLETMSRQTGVDIRANSLGGTADQLVS